MKKLYVNVLALVLSCLPVLGATSITTSYGRTFVFGDWSGPSVLSVKSVSGEVALVRKTCAVTIPDAISPQAFNVELLWYPAAKQVWIGNKAQEYVIVGEKIWGLSMNMRNLTIKPSLSAETASRGEELILEDFLKQFLEDPQGVDYFGSDGISSLDMCRIFGYSAIYKDNDVYHPRNIITNVVVDGTGMTAALVVVTGKTLSLTLNPNFEVVAAAVEGNPIPVLFEGFVPMKEFMEWSSPEPTLIPSGTNSASVLSFGRDYLQPGLNTLETAIPVSVRAIVLASGDVWIGPRECKLAIIEGRIVGANVNEAGECQLFTRIRGRIPISPESRSVCRNVLNQFEQDFAANGHQFRPDFRLSLPVLFAGDNRFSAPSDFNLRMVRVRDNKLDMFFYLGNPNAYPEIVMGPDGTIVSTQVLDGLALSRAGASVPYMIDLPK